MKLMSLEVGIQFLFYAIIEGDESDSNSRQDEISEKEGKILPVY